MSNTGLGPKRLKRGHSAAGSKGHPCDRPSTLRSIVWFTGKYLSKLNSEINKTQCSGPRHGGGGGGGRSTLCRVPWGKFGPFSIFSICIFSPFSDFQSHPLVQEKPHPCATDTFLFSLHEIHLVPSVFPFPPLYLQEHPILFRSLLTALNKYTFWDLTEQAILFQTTSALAQGSEGPSWLTACGHFRPQDSLVHHWVPRAEVPNLAAHSAPGERPEAQTAPRQFHQTLRVGSRLEAQWKAAQVTAVSSCAEKP